MAGLFVQQKQGSAASTGTQSVSGSFTSTAGNALVLIVTYNGASTTVTPATSFGTFVEDVSLRHDPGGGGVGMYVFTMDSCIGNTGTLTTTFGATRTNRGHYILELSGIDHYIGGVFPAYQVTPGTGGDAITTGNYNVVNPPNYLLSLAWDQNGGGTAPAIGASSGAFSLPGAATNGWLFGDATGNATTPDIRKLSSGNIAATFQAADGATSTFAALLLAFAEQTASTVLMSQCMY